MSHQLSNEEIRSRISEIISGQKIVELPSGDGGSETFVFRIPRSNIKLRADIFYKKMREKAIKFGIPSKQHMERLCKKHNVIDTAFIDVMKERVQKRLDKEKTILTHSRHPQQIAEKQIKVKALEREVNRWESRKHAIFWHTAENKAEQYRTLYLICEGVFNLDGERRWKNIDEFLNDSSCGDQNQLVAEYVRYAEGLDTTTIRAIARHPEWMIYWRSLKSSNGQLFTEPISDWDVNKLLLVHWAQFYDDILRSPEPPPANIIDNDSELDKWLKDRRVISDRNARRSVSTTADGKIKTTYNVNQPYKLVTNKEADVLRNEGKT